VSGQSKKSSESSKKKRATAMVDDADVQGFVDALMNDQPFARAPNAELAYRLALAAQGVAPMTSGYASASTRTELLRLIDPARLAPFADRRAAILAVYERDAWMRGSTMGHQQLPQ
jgi:hypothetical protein